MGCTKMAWFVIMTLLALTHLIPTFANQAPQRPTGSITLVADASAAVADANVNAAVADADASAATATDNAGKQVVLYEIRPLSRIRPGYLFELWEESHKLHGEKAGRLTREHIAREASQVGTLVWFQTWWGYFVGNSNDNARNFVKRAREEKASDKRDDQDQQAAALDGNALIDVGGSGSVDGSASGSGSITIGGRNVGNQWWQPVLNLFSFTNCTNAAEKPIGDRLSYQGDDSIGCDGPVLYTYDAGPPAKQDKVWMITRATFNPNTGIAEATFRMFSDAQCTKNYNFMTWGNWVTMTQNSCSVYSTDWYNPKKVLSASVLFSAAGVINPSNTLVLALVSLATFAAAYVGRSS